MRVRQIVRGMALGAALLGLAAPAAHARSGDSVAPPGNSAVDQYRESLPPSSKNARKLSQRDRQRLAEQGRDGQALAAVLERSGGVPRADRAAADQGGAKRRTSKQASPDTESPRTTSADDDAASIASSETRGTAPAAAASTIGPVPVWAMLVGAVLLVGVGLLVRTRLTP